MRTTYLSYLLIFIIACNPSETKEKKEVFSGNPVFDGWYADPEAIIYVYPRRKILLHVV